MDAVFMCICTNLIASVNLLTHACTYVYSTTVKHYNVITIPFGEVLAKLDASFCSTSAAVIVTRAFTAVVSLVIAAG